jgi:two-component system LytT family response regulator
MDKIIIIDNNEIQDELEKFIVANKKHILFNSDMDLLSLERNPILKDIIENYESKHKIKIHTKSRVWFFKSREIVRFEAGQGNTTAYLTNKNHSVINENIDQIESQLKDFSFLRIHNDHIVNMVFITRIYEDNKEKVTLTNGDILPIDNQRKQYILETLEKYNKL